MDNYDPRDVSLNTFEYMGCWICSLFEKTNDNYLYTYEAAGLARVTKQTILNWLKHEKIDGALYEIMREDLVLPIV